MKKVTFSEWDPAEHLNSIEDVIAYLEVHFEDNDPDALLSAVGDITRSKGMTKIAKKLKMDRAGLYRALAPDGNPSFKTVYKLIDLLGLQIKLVQKQSCMDYSQQQVEARA